MLAARTRHSPFHRRGCPGGCVWCRRSDRRCRIHARRTRGGSFCDALAIGHGLKAETQIADLLGAEFAFDHTQRQWLPQADKDGRSSIADVYLAGDGPPVRGSEIAEATGRIAAHALLGGRGYSEQTVLGRNAVGSRNLPDFVRPLDQTFEFPHAAAGKLTDDVIVCRCEELTAGTIRRAVLASGELEINRIKAFCRVGMGRCQGRICGAVAAELIAATAGVTIETVGRIRAQAPRQTGDARGFGQGTIMRDVFDIAIVGGGLAGCSTALHAALKGASVVLLERGRCGAQASGVNYGGVRQQGRHLGRAPVRPPQPQDLG